MRKKTPNTVTELLRNCEKDVTMTLLGCDEKYNNGLASDYEWLAEWERILPLCAGTGAAVLYEEELRLLELPHGTPAELWQVGNAKLTEKTSVSPTDRNRFDVGEFLSNSIMNSVDTPDGYPTLLLAAKEGLNLDETKEIHVFIDVESATLPTVSPHHAHRAWDTLNSAEKFNKESESILRLQLLIDLLLEAKKQKKRGILHVRGVGTEALLAYLSAHRLVPDETRVGIDLNTPREWTVTLCRAYRGTPELWLVPSDFGMDLSARLTRFFSVYPIGGVRFGGALTDSPLTEAAMSSLLRKELQELTAHWGMDEANACKLTEEFFTA